MSCIERQALSGLNETLQTIRKAQEQFPEQEQLVSIVPFESENIRLLRDKEPIGQVKDLQAEEYRPGGCTPLFDAIGFGIQSIRKQVQEADSVLVTIITDGYENASKEFSGNAIAALIDVLKQQGWMFTYIGANQDAVEVAKSLNISNALNFVQDEEGTAEMFRKERKSRARFMADVAFCCSMDEPSAKQYKRKMANSSAFFEEDDK